MHLKRTKPEPDDTLRDAAITADHPSSREGVPVLLVEGDLVPVVEASEAGYEIVRATDAERAALLQGGYALRDAAVVEAA